MEEKELLNKVVIFVFFVQKVFLYLHNITFEPLMSNGLYECGVLLLSMHSQKALGFIKIS